MVNNRKIKIVGISGSPRDRSTNYMLKTLLNATGSSYELILLKDKKFSFCNACGGCFHSHKCVLRDDMQGIYLKLQKADIIVFGSPTYFGNVTGLMKKFIDRCIPLYLAGGLKGKKAALLSVGNFRKGEARFFDKFDIEKAMKCPKQKKELEKPIKKCLNMMKSFCEDHMMMKVVGAVVAVNGDPKSKDKDLIRLGNKLIS